MASHKDVKKVVLAYSGGLDTSIILKWLQTELGAEVVTFTADLGQGEELTPAREKAERAGASSSPCPRSAVKVTTSAPSSVCSHVRMIDVSSPPE